MDGLEDDPASFRGFMACFQGRRHVRFRVSYGKDIPIPGHPHPISSHKVGPLPVASRKINSTYSTYRGHFTQLSIQSWIFQPFI